MRDWSPIEQEFVHGSMSLADLAATHGISDSTMRSRAHRCEWQRKRDELQQIATAKADAEMVDRRADELAKFNENDLKMAKAIRAKAAQLLNSVGSPQDLRSLASALDTAQRVGRLALGATTENSGISSPSGGPVQAMIIEFVDASTVPGQA